MKRGLIVDGVHSRPSLAFYVHLLLTPLRSVFQELREYGMLVCFLVVRQVQTGHMGLDGRLTLVFQLQYILELDYDGRDVIDHHIFFLDDLEPAHSGLLAQDLCDGYVFDCYSGLLVVERGVVALQGVVVLFAL